ncbi:MAG: hypothetical protein IKC71_01660 [Clostridia bacterium]|nr:hypothetical protein [Clostridia bacterium]
MVKVKFAGIVIQVNNKYSFIERQCANYLVDNDTLAQIVITVKDEDIEKEILDNPFSIGKGRAESFCAYREISKKLAEFDAFLLHASIVSYKNQGFAFLGKSGTGKSTHASLWQKRFEDVVFINDDKPIIRKEGNFLAYGTPYSGKRNFNTNTFVELKALYFLEQSKTNEIKKLSKEQAIFKLIPQVIMPENKEDIEKTLALFDELLSLPCYLLKCNISFEAVDIAYQTFLGEYNEN